MRFRHDRIREAILAGLDPPRRRALQLAMARRLAGVPELFAVAAEQYLPVVDAVDDAAERRAVVGLLRRAADQAALIGDHALVNALLAAALRLIDPGETATLVEVHTGRHAALFSLGRLEEADEEYRTIEGLCPTALERADATAVQVRSLTHRNRFAEAIGLGLESLRELGIAVPAADRLPAELDHQFDHLYRWLDHTDAADDLARPEITDPTLLAATRLLNAVLPAAYFVADPATYRLAEPGGAADLARARPGPYPGRPGEPRRLRRGGAARRLRRRVPGGAADPGAGRGPRLRARHLAGALPVRSPQLLVRADRERCPRGSAGPGGADRGRRPGQRRLHLPRGRVLPAGLRAIAGRFVAEVEAGLAFVRRTGNEQTGQWLDRYRWLAGVLRGESSAAAGEAVPIDRYADNPLALLYAHITRAIAAAIFGDPVGLARHTAAAMPLLPAAPGPLPDRRGPPAARAGPRRAGPHRRR